VPTIDKDITNSVYSCSFCKSNNPAPTKEYHSSVLSCVQRISRAIRLGVQILSQEP